MKAEASTFSNSDKYIFNIYSLIYKTLIQLKEQHNTALYNNSYNFSLSDVYQKKNSGFFLSLKFSKRIFVKGVSNTLAL